jgi:hypothetical protein
MSMGLEPELVSIKIDPNGTSQVSCVAAMRELDANWLENEGVSCLIGGAAEARLLGVPFRLPSDELHCEGDEQDLDQLATRHFGDRDWREPRCWAETEWRFVIMRIAEATVADPNVWRAITALASTLKMGTNDGRTAAATIMRALGR